MSTWREKLSVLVAVPKCFDLLTHETKRGFQIVEPKDIPDQIPIICSPLTTFFHEELVTHLQKCDAGIEEVKPVRIFRKSSGFTSNEYFTLNISNQPPFIALSANGFRPSLINMVEGFHDAVFFSRDYYNLVSSETNLLFQEVPIIFLIPLGQGR